MSHVSSKSNDNFEILDFMKKTYSKEKWKLNILIQKLLMIKNLRYKKKVT
jgi:hypothetical protein